MTCVGDVNARASVTGKVDRAAYKGGPMEGKGRDKDEVMRTVARGHPRLGKIRGEGDDAVPLEQGPGDQRLQKSASQRLSSQLPRTVTMLADFSGWRCLYSTNSKRVGERGELNVERKGW